VPGAFRAARSEARNTELQDSGKLYWEDFEAGATLPMGERRVARDEVIAFAREFDPQPFHVDEAAAARSMYGGLIASGWHTVALVMRMMCDSYLNRAASLGSPGIDNLRWLKPVRPGDTIRAQRTVMETRASKSRPDMGLVRMRWEVVNQHDELVMTLEGTQMFVRRSPGAA
jgi:acyl dehydratase